MKNAGQCSRALNTTATCRGDTIERMGRHFTALLEAALSQPDQPVAALST